MSELENYLMNKVADVSGTSPMPTGAKPPADPTLNPARTIRKIAGDAEDVGTLAKTEGQPGETPKALPQAAPFKLDVGTTDKGPSAATQTKQAQRYALPSLRHYPLDNYAQVKTAAEYFGQWSNQMAPEMRREFCTNVVKRADELGIKVAAAIRHYGATDYARPSHIEACLESRRGVVKEAQFQPGLDYLKANRASMKADDFATALGEFDKVAGISAYYDRDIPDPYWSTFGEKVAEDEDGSILVGNDYISYEELRCFAKVHSCKLKDTFGDDFAEEFRKDPVGVTNSLPVDQKKIVLRLASSTLTNPTVT